MQDKLFRGLPSAALLHADRPEPLTTPLACYVVSDLPADLYACVSGTLSILQMAAKHHQLLEKEAARIRRITDPAAAQEVQLDLVMMLGGYLPGKAETYAHVPALLHELLDSNARKHDLPRRMTYELLVDVNTELFVQSGGNIRIFSVEPVVARIERDFFIGHHFAERHIRHAYETLNGLLDDPDRPQKTEQLRSILSGLQRFTEFMAAYSRLPHKEYAYFRRFFMPYPDPIKTKNASGAFMPTPQLFEMLLHSPSTVQSSYVTTNMQYFPRWAQPLLVSQAAEATAGKTLKAMVASGQLSLTPAEQALMGQIVEQFIQFKLTHIKVVTTKIPEAFPPDPIVEREALRGACPFLNATRTGTGAQQGTGGFAPQDFLGDGVQRLLTLQEELAL